MSIYSEEILKVLELDDPVRGLFEGSNNLLRDFVQFLDADNNGELAQNIIDADGYKKKYYIKGLVSLYPLSANILKKVMNEIKSNDMSQDMSEWFDIEGVIYTTYNKFVSMCNNSDNLDNNITDIQSQKAELEKKKEGLNQKLEEVKKLKEANSVLADEVRKLEEDCKEFEKYSEENLNNKKSEYKNKLAELKRNKKTYDAEVKKIAKIEEELQKALDGNSDESVTEEYKKATEALVNVMKNLPKDEADIDG